MAGPLLAIGQEVQATADEVYEAVIRWLDIVRDENAEVLDTLIRWYVASALALGAEVILWTVALTT